MAMGPQCPQRVPREAHASDECIRALRVRTASDSALSVLRRDRASSENPSVASSARGRASDEYLSALCARPDVRRVTWTPSARGRAS